MPSMINHEINKIRGKITKTGKVYTDSISNIIKTINEIEKNIKSLTSDKDNLLSRINNLTGKVSQAITAANSSLKKTGDTMKGTLTFSSGIKASTILGIAVKDSIGTNKAQLAKNGSPAILTDQIGEFTGAAGVTIDGLILKDGNCDGRDIATDGTKLDTIDNNADVTGSNNPQVHGIASHTDRSRTIFISNSIYTNGDYGLSGILLDQTVVQKSIYAFKLPSDFVSLTTVKMVYLFPTMAMVQQHVIFDYGCKFGSNGELADFHSNGSTGQDITIPQFDQNNIHETTLAASLFANITTSDYVRLTLERDADHGTDNHPGDTCILGVLITYLSDE